MGIFSKFIVEFTIMGKLQTAEARAMQIGDGVV